MLCWREFLFIWFTFSVAYACGVGRGKGALLRASQRSRGGMKRFMDVFSLCSTPLKWRAEKILKMTANKTSPNRSMVKSGQKCIDQSEINENSSNHFFHWNLRPISLEFDYNVFHFQITWLNPPTASESPRWDLCQTNEWNWHLNFCAQVPVLLADQTGRAARPAARVDGFSGRIGRPGHSM